MISLAKTRQSWGGFENTKAQETDVLPVVLISVKPMVLLSHERVIGEEKFSLIETNRTQSVPAHKNQTKPHFKLPANCFWGSLSVVLNASPIR